MKTVKMLTVLAAALLSACFNPAPYAEGADDEIVQPEPVVVIVEVDRGLSALECLMGVEQLSRELVNADEGRRLEIMVCMDKTRDEIKLGLAQYFEQVAVHGYCSGAAIGVQGDLVHLFYDAPTAEDLAAENARLLSQDDDVFIFAGLADIRWFQVRSEDGLEFQRQLQRRHEKTDEDKVSYYMSRMAHLMIEPEVVAE